MEMMKSFNLLTYFIVAAPRLVYDSVHQGYIHPPCGKLVFYLQQMPTLIWKSLTIADAVAFFKAVMDELKSESVNAWCLMEERVQ